MMAIMVVLFNGLHYLSDVTVLLCFHSATVRCVVGGGHSCCLSETAPFSDYHGFGLLVSMFGLRIWEGFAHSFFGPPPVILP